MEAEYIDVGIVDFQFP